MIARVKHFNASRLHLAGGMKFTTLAYKPRPRSRRGDNVASVSTSKFPRRPDASVICETIPLFHIAQNNNGFWLARDADGQNGGLFFLKRSALGFAGKKSESMGCATMVLSESYELDVPNQGGQVAAIFDAAVDAIARRAPTLASFVRMAMAEWRKLITETSHALAGERHNREAIEKELFRGQYTLASKNDDDFPVVR
jgi:hypothetical protein